MSFHRSRTTALLAAAVLATALSACSGASSSSGAGTPQPTSPAATSSTTSDDASASPTTPGATTSAAEDDGRVVEITVANNKVSGPKGRVKVTLGEKVTLRVTSDVADEIHLHGYDKHADVEAGGTADLTFTANVPGVFEVELESRALQLAQLQVQ